MLDREKPRPTSVVPQRPSFLAHCSLLIDDGLPSKAFPHYLPLPRTSHNHHPNRVYTNIPHSMTSGRPSLLTDLPTAATSSARKPRHPLVLRLRPRRTRPRYLRPTHQAKVLRMAACSCYTHFVSSYVDLFSSPLFLPFPFSSFDFGLASNWVGAGLESDAVRSCVVMGVLVVRIAHSVAFPFRSLRSRY